MAVEKVYTYPPLRSTTADESAYAGGGRVRLAEGLGKSDLTAFRPECIVINPIYLV